MASFQVPQFLDSGDKILFNLNLRQFGYALGGFLITMAIFSIMNAFFPGIGLYGFLPAVPVMGLSAYAALGSFNGRDADFYIVKFIIYQIKSKEMVFTRQPDVSDLDERLNEWSESKIKQRWADRLAKQKGEIDGVNSFSGQTVQTKATQIRDLGQSIDSNINNALIKVQREQLLMERRKQLLQNPKGNNSPQSNSNSSKPRYSPANFFDEEEEN